MKLFVRICIVHVFIWLVAGYSLFFFGFQNHYSATQHVLVYANSAEQQSIPEWFKQKYPLPQQVDLQQKLTPEQVAYQSLWSSYQNQKWLYSLIICIAVSLGMGVLYWVFSTLQSIYRQAEAICAHNFQVNEQVPPLSTLATIVEAFNLLINRVKQMYKEHATLNAAMRRRAFSDSVTGLGNRRYFESYFEHMLSATETGTISTLLMVRVSDLQNYLHTQGYQAHDKLLNQIARVLENIKTKYQSPLLCHFGSGDFVLLLVHHFGEKVDEICEKLIVQLDEVNELAGIQESSHTVIGANSYSTDAYALDVFNKTEKALNYAQMHNKRWHYEPLKQELEALNSLDLSGLLKKRLQEQEIVLQHQPVFYYEQDGTLMFHNEVLLRIKGEHKELFSAGLFIPLLDRMRLAESYDRLVLEQVFEHILDTPDGSQRYGVNLSQHAITNPEFALWLVEQLNTLDTFSGRITLEFPEYYVKDHVEAIASLIELVKPFGVQVGLDHFGCGFSSFGYLDKIQVDFIKIDGSYIRHIEENIDKQMIVRSFIEVAHGLDILVFATGVETEEERAALNELKIDGMQGYFLGQPS